MFELKINANVFNDRMKLANYRKMVELIGNETRAIGFIPVGNEFSEYFWTYVVYFYDGTQNITKSIKDDRDNRNIFVEDKDITFENWVHKSDEFTFEFPDEETALYFQLKFCP